MVLKKKQRQIFECHIELVILIATEKSVIKMFREKCFPDEEKKQNGLTEKWWL